MYTSTTLLLCAPCVFVLYLLQRKYVREALFTKDGCKKPVCHVCKDPFYGMDFTLPTIRDISINLRHFRKHGHTFAVVPILRNGRYHTTSPENIQIILTSPKTWGIQPARLPAMEEAYGRSFITMDGEIMAHSKKLLRPSFSKFSSHHFSTIVSEVQEFLDRVPHDGTTVDLQPLIFQIFFRSSLNFLLGIHPSEGARGAPYSVSEFEKSWNDVMFGLGLRLAFPLLASLLPKTKYKQGLRIFHGFLDYYVQQALQRKASQVNSEVKNESKSKDSMLDDLAAQTEDPLYLRALVAQSLLASNATTSWLVSNTLFSLARDPLLWAQLRREALAAEPEIVQKPDGLLGSTLYTHVLQETLRLYPIFPNLARIALHDTRLPTGGGPSQADPVFVPKGDAVIGNTYVLHRDPDVFGQDVAAFNPARWKTIKPDQYQYLPFGLGSRACLGKQKALLETTYIVAQMAARFKVLQSRDSREWKADLKGSCKNANGCMVALGVE